MSKGFVNFVRPEHADIGGVTHVATEDSGENLDNWQDSAIDLYGGERQWISHFNCLIRNDEFYFVLFVNTADSFLLSTHKGDSICYLLKSEVLSQRFGLTLLQHEAKLLLILKFELFNHFIMSTNKDDPLMSAHSAHGQYTGIS